MSIIKRTEFLPYGRQSIVQSDIDAVVGVLESDWLTTGPAVIEFEEKLAESVGAQYAVSCSSGTAALHLSLLAIGVTKGDSVVVPSITFVATANAVRYVNADVIFCDVLAENGLIDADKLESILLADHEKMIKAIIPVHLNGQAVDILRINELAKNHNVFVIEDGCHALGSEYSSDTKSERIGSCRKSDLCVFSFHPVKTVTMGEGGAITTNCQKSYNRMISLRSHGMTRDVDEIQNAAEAFDKERNINFWYYEIQELGFNYRATDIQCALGTSQLTRLDKTCAKINLLVQHYDNSLGEIKPALRLIRKKQDVLTCWHLYVVLIDFTLLKIDRNKLMHNLLDFNIGSQVHYIPVDRQPYYKKLEKAVFSKKSNSYYEKCLSLPLYEDMVLDDVVYVCDVLKYLIQKFLK